MLRFQRLAPDGRRFLSSVSSGLSIAVHSSFRPPAEGETYLCYVVECKRALAFPIVVSAVAESVVRADEDLLRASRSVFSPSYGPNGMAGCKACYTSWVPPGSLTVASCSSLYLWKAGRMDWRMLGVAAVRDLMSAGRR